MSEAYKNAGVDIEAGYEAVKRMKKHVERTKRLGVMGTLAVLAACLTCLSFLIKNQFSFRERTVSAQN